MDIILSKSTWPIIGWVCEILGWLINGIYVLLEAIGIPNIGIAIILFTIVIYALLTPTQIKQQKWSKMMTVIQPELQQIQKKYAIEYFDISPFTYEKTRKYYLFMYENGAAKIIELKDL